MALIAQLAGPKSECRMRLVCRDFNKAIKEAITEAVWHETNQATGPGLDITDRQAGLGPAQSRAMGGISSPRRRQLLPLEPPQASATARAELHRRETDAASTLGAQAPRAPADPNR